MNSAARTLIQNATIVTLNAENSVIAGGSVAITGGRITAIGSPTDAVDSMPGDLVIDAAGAIVLPGLINAHAHLAMSLFRGVADGLDLDGFLSKVLPIEDAVLDAEVVQIGSELAAVESLRAGITSALDMYFFPGSVQVAASRVGFNVHNGPVFIEFPGPDNRTWDARMTWARRYLVDRPVADRWVCPHSTYLLSEHQLRDVAALADDVGARIHVHAAETRAELAQVGARHNGRTPIEVLADCGLLSDRTVLAHAVHVTDSDIDRIARAGSHVSHNPASNAKLASGLAPVRKMLNAGINVALGTDGASSANDIDLWMAIRLAGFLPSLINNDPGGLTAAELIRMCTINGARAIGAQSEKGTIEVGKDADLVVLDSQAAAMFPSYNPFSTLAYATTRAEVRHVFVAGELRVSNGLVTTAPPDLHSRVAGVAERVRAFRVTAEAS